MTYARGFAITILLAASMVGGGASALAQTSSAPDTYSNADIAAYRILFRRVVIYKQMSDEAISNGQDKSYLAKSIQNRLKLGDTDMMNLQIVALDCEKELEPIHAQRKAIIAKFLSRFPGNKVPSGTILSPPPELAQLQASENAIIWAHRNKFKQTVTTDTFQRADMGIRHDYGNQAMNPSVVTPNGGSN